LKILKIKCRLILKMKEMLIYLLGYNPEDFNCSEYLHKICKVEFSPAPYFNLEEEFRLHEAVIALHQKENDTFCS